MLRKSISLPSSNQLVTLCYPKSDAFSSQSHVHSRRITHSYETLIKIAVNLPVCLSVYLYMVKPLALEIDIIYAKCQYFTKQKR